MKNPKRMAAVLLVFVLIFSMMPMAFAQETGAVGVIEPTSSFTTEPMISAGGDHTVALRYDGTVWAWGDNRDGQLGDGTTTGRHTPVQVRGVDNNGFLENIVAVAAGNMHTLALQEDGTVLEWGEGVNHTPVQVQGLDGNIVAIAAGSGQSVALRDDGTVWEWSLGWFAEQVPGFYGGATAIAMGSHLVVLDSNSRVWEVRSNTEMVEGLTGNITSIAAGEFHYAALREDGTVWTWGNNYRGQLGNGTFTNSWDAVQVQGLSGVTAIAANGQNTVAIVDNDRVWAWGCNIAGQLGNGTSSSTGINVPVQTLNIRNVEAISAGGGHTIAIDGNGAVWAWGIGESGNLGDGTSSDSYVPVRVLGGGTGETFLNLRAASGLCSGCNNSEANCACCLDCERFPCVCGGGLGDIIVHATNNANVFINLTTETIHGLPFAAAEFSANGRSWNRRAAQQPGNGGSISHLLNRELTLTVREARGNEATQIVFPTINRRPRANAERLRPWYGADTWTLRARPARDNTAARPPAAPGLLYERVEGDDRGRIPTSPQWETLPQGFSIEILPTGERSTHFFRSVASAPTGTSGEAANFTPAGRPFRVRPAQFRRALSVRIAYAPETLRVRIGDEYSVDGGETWRRPGDTGFELDARNRAVPLNVSQYITGETTILLRTAATGRRTRSMNQVIVPLTRAPLMPPGMVGTRIVPIIASTRRLNPAHLQRTVSVAGVNRSVVYNIRNPDTSRWVAVPRFTSPTTTPIFTTETHDIRLSASARFVGGQWHGYAASLPGTITVHTGEIGPDSRGRIIFGVTHAVIAPAGTQSLESSLSLDVNDGAPSVTTGAALQIDVTTGAALQMPDYE